MISYGVVWPDGERQQNVGDCDDQCAEVLGVVEDLIIAARLEAPYGYHYAVTLVGGAAHITIIAALDEIVVDEIPEPEPSELADESLVIYAPAADAGSSASGG